MSELIDYWRKRIERDLGPFIDPGTQLETIIDGYAIRCEWQQRRKTLEGTFRVSPSGGEVSVDFIGSRYSYRSFFASADMADLLGLAKMILQSKKPSIYIETSAHLENDDQSPNPKPATELIAELISAPDELGTVLTMITGEAGAGKTSALKQLVRNAAEKLIRGQNTRLLLYVDAQGRALARFSEALATELQDLRVNLTYHAVSTLVRLGLITPVIDGFDELIGVGGYDDAFSSISSFIEDLDGLGSIIASARSTYYEHEFLSRANRVSELGSHVWRLQSVQISAWGDSERSQYVKERCLERHLGESQSSGIATKVRTVFTAKNAALGKKPLFIARTVDALLSDVDLSGDGALLDRLVSAFLLREQKEKLLAKNGIPLLTADQLVSLYADLAEEMWNQSTRELDKGSIRELAELALLDTALPAKDQQVIIERMPSLAFLQRGESPGSISFEHEIFFSHFLAKKIASRVGENSASLSILLGRSVLPEGLSESVAHALKATEESINSVIAMLCGAASIKSLRQAQARENSALLIAALLGDASDRKLYKELHIRDVVFPGASLRDVRFDSSTFHNVEFRRTEFCGTIFSNCRAEDCTFASILVDKSTILDIGACETENFQGLQILESNNKITQLFDPIEIREELKLRRLPSAMASVTDVRRSVQEEVVDLISKFSRTFAKRNPVCIDDDFLQNIFGSPNWPPLQKIFLRTGIVREELRAAHGPRRSFLRKLVNHEEIPLGVRRDFAVSPEIKAFWNAVEGEFPSKKERTVRI